MYFVLVLFARTLTRVLSQVWSWQYCVNVLSIKDRDRRAALQMETEEGSRIVGASLEPSTLLVLTYVQRRVAFFIAQYLNHQPDYHSMRWAFSS
jgi:hypothetical protein